MGGRFDAYHLHRAFMLWSEWTNLKVAPDRFHTGLEIQHLLGTDWIVRIIGSWPRCDAEHTLRPNGP